MHNQYSSFRASQHNEFDKNFLTAGGPTVGFARLGGE